MVVAIARHVRRGIQENGIRIALDEIGIQEKTDLRVKTNLRVKAKNKIFFLLTGLILLVSCKGEELYFQYQKVEKGDWYRDSVLTFTLDTLNANQIGEYNISLELTTSMLYPFSDIQLKIDHNLNDTIISSDTMRYRVADEHGKWLGKGVGSLRQLSIPYKSDIWLDSTRSYELRVFHLIKADPLKGVEKVGIRVFKEGY